MIVSKIPSDAHLRSTRAHNNDHNRQNYQLIMFLHSYILINHHQIHIALYIGIFAASRVMSL